MAAVLISGWNESFQKVEFTRLMKSAMGLALAPAKRITDRIVDGELAGVGLPDEQVEELLSAMAQLGARCQVAAVQR